jgi:hypothetical protein
MKLRKDTSSQADAQESRDEMREIAEAVSLYRSAMHHVAEKQATRPAQLAVRPAKTLRMRLLLVPALGGALAVAVIAPVLMHWHPRPTPVQPVTTAQGAQPPQEVAQTNVSDTELMDRIDNDLTQDVPDALQPLDMSEQGATTNTNSENKNVTQE